MWACGGRGPGEEARPRHLGMGRSTRQIAFSLPAEAVRATCPWGSGSRLLTSQWERVKFAPLGARAPRFRDGFRMEADDDDA